MTETTTIKQTIKKIQSVDYESGGLAYHLLQPEVARVGLSDGSVVARMGADLIGDPVVAAGGHDGFADVIADEIPGASLFHIGASAALALGAKGFKVGAMGVESRVGLPFSLSGRGKADLRRALNRSLGAGVSVREVLQSDYFEYEDLIFGLNLKWLQGRRFFKREFRFLARPLERRYKAGERRFVAFRNNSPVGIAVYDPVFEGGVLIGYFEAIVRAFDTAAGIRDHLTLTALAEFGNDCSSVRWVSLGLCPFAPLVKSESDGLSDGLSYGFNDISSVTKLILAGFYRFGGRLFNCRGLAFHKGRYRGESVGVYFATKSSFPILALYRACRISHIDPLHPVLDFIVPSRLWARISPVKRFSPLSFISRY